MCKAKNKPFYQQINGLITSCFLAMFLLVITTVWFIDYKEGQIDYLENDQLPQLSQLQQQQQQLQVVLAKVNDQIKLKTAQSLAAQHDEITQLLLPLKKADVFAAVSSYRFFGDVTIKSNLIRISQNSVRNIELKNRAQDKLALVIDSLSSTLMEIENRTKYAVAKDTVILYKLNVAINKLTNQLANLSMRTSSAEFEVLAQYTKISTQLYQKLSLSFITEEPQLSNDFLAFEQVMLTEQRTLSKWRGYIRLLEPYLTELLKQPAILNTGINQQNEKFKNALQASPKQNLTTSVTNKLINQLTSKLTLTSLNHAVYAFLAALAGTIVIAFLLLKKRIKRNSKHTLAICEELSTGEFEGQTEAHSQEQQALITLIGKLNDPRNTEADKKQLEVVLKQQARHLLTHRQVISWTFDQYNVVQPNYLFKELLNTETINPNTKWRSWFDLRTQRELIAKARAANRTGNVESLSVVTISGVPLSISMSYQDGFLTGTAANNKTGVSKQEKLARLSSQQELAEQSQLNHQQYINDMLVSCLLQNQHVLLDANVPSLKVQRKLIKLLDLNQQIQTTQSLLTSKAAKKLSDVSIVEQLYCSAFNLMVEARTQQNQFVFICADNLIDTVKLDSQNFYHLMHSMAKVIFTGLFNAKVALNVTLGDKNSGQQTLRFMVEVNTGALVESLPNALRLLQKYIDSPEELPQSSYTYHLAIMLKLFHAGSMQCDIHQPEGYRLSFDLPLAVSNEQVNHKNCDLKTAQLLVLSRDIRLSNVLSLAVNKANGRIECIDKLESLNEKLQVNTLKQKPIKLIVLAEDSAVEAFDEINQTIQKLPKRLQPKVLVMPPFFSNFQRYGLYSQSDNLVTASSILAEIESLLASGQTDNQLLAANNSNSLALAPSCTEMLIALKSPEKQQGLLKVIHGLGIQVTLVCDTENLNRLWKTGRFTILLNELSYSPLISLSSGKNIKRAIFSYNEQSLSSEESEIAKRWFVTQPPKIDDTKHWVRLLKPWLNSSEKVSTAVKYNLTNDTTEEPTALRDLTEELLDFDESFIDDLLHQPLPVFDANAAFDLNAYAVHHGSPELAVIMLDEYLNELTDNIALLERYLVENQISGITKVLDDIHKVAKILAAAQLQVYCDTAKRQTDQKQINAASIDLFKQELSEIKRYAEQI